MVSCLSSMKAIFSLVPTPSVELTRTGCCISAMWRWIENSPAKPPISLITPGRLVCLVIRPMALTSVLAFSMSTPASE